MSKNELREIVISLPEPWSLNNLLRQSYHMRNQRREMLKSAIAAQMPRGWKPMKYVQVDAHLSLASLRDDFELPACLKIELDAAQEVALIDSDGPRALIRGSVTQSAGSARGVRLRFVELPKAPKREKAAF